MLSLEFSPHFWFVSGKGTAEFFTIKPKTRGLYQQFINNDGKPTCVGATCEIREKWLSFVHWTSKFTTGRFLVCDVKGAKHCYLSVSAIVFLNLEPYSDHCYPLNILFCLNNFFVFNLSPYKYFLSDLGCNLLLLELRT